MALSGLRSMLCRKVSPTIIQCFTVQCQRISGLCTYSPLFGSESSERFEDLLRNSPLMKLDRFEGQTVIGKITHVCGDDLYVDYGGKFEAVVKRPFTNAKYYEEGKLVEMVINKQEVTGHFLGQSRRITLLEADATLIGPLTSRSGVRKRKVNPAT